MQMGPVEAISKYFGCEPDREGIRESATFELFHFDIGPLKYQIWLELRDRMLAISGDPTFPFSRESLYEVQVPFDRIAIETEECYGDQPILVCRKDFAAAPNLKTLMIVKCSDTRISVWQSYPFER